jgi:hypothetical protein
MAIRPKFSRHMFNHMRRLIHKVKHRAVTRDDLDTTGDAELLDALLLRFVEHLIVEGSITCWSPATEVQSILPATSNAG